MKLTVKAIEAAQPRKKPFKIYDGAGLHLEVRPNGGKYWRQDYSWAGRKKRLSLGVFPDVGLKEVRLKSYEIRSAVARGLDPSKLRKDKRDAVIAANQRVEKLPIFTIKELFEGWIAWKKEGWSIPYARRVEGRVRSSNLSFVGGESAEEMPRRQLVLLLGQIVQSGRVDTAHRIADYLRSAYEWAEDSGKIHQNRARRLRQTLPQKRVTHWAYFSVSSLARRIFTSM